MPVPGAFRDLGELPVEPIDQVGRPVHERKKIPVGILGEEVPALVDGESRHLILRVREI